MLQPVILGPGHDPTDWLHHAGRRCPDAHANLRLRTPMIWSKVGDAMNCTVNLRTRIKTFTYVDDFLGGGKQDHIRHAASVVHEIIRYFWFKEYLDGGFTKLDYLRSEDYPADLLASVRSGAEFKHFTNLIMGSI